MKAIGFKNFRKFENFPMLELGKITLLVGGNNAGKSTVVKAIISLLTFLKNVRFDTAFDVGSIRNVRFYFNNSMYTHVGTFVRALYNKAKSQTIEFKAVIENFLIEVKLKGQDRDENTTYALVPFIRVKDLHSLIEYEYNLEDGIIKVSFFRNVEKFETDEKYRSTIEEIKEYEQKMNSSEYKLLNKRKFERASRLLQESFPVIDEDFTLTVNIAKISRRYMVGGPLLSGVIYNFCEYFDDKAEDFDNTEEKKHIEKLKEVQTYMHRTTRNWDHMFLAFPLVEYIYAHSASQSAFYNAMESGDFMVQTIHQFASLKKATHQDEYAFVRKWMKKIEIGDDFYIDSIRGEAHSVTVIEDGNKIQLGDKGMGSIQMMILLFRIALIVRHDAFRFMHIATTVIVEEPEQNLHPKMQSLLMDFFAEITEQYGIHFVIETHSEYLIRRSQVLVAEKKYKDQETLDAECPFKVYYFPKEGSPYDMKFEPSGRFIRQFGEGFFDEALMSALELNRIERQSR